MQVLLFHQLSCVLAWVSGANISLGWRKLRAPPQKAIGEPLDQKWIVCLDFLQGLENKTYQHPHQHIAPPPTITRHGNVPSSLDCPIVIVFESKRLALVVCVLKEDLVATLVCEVPSNYGDGGEIKFHGSIQVVHGLNNLGMLAIGE